MTTPQLAATRQPLVVPRAPARVRTLLEVDVFSVVVIAIWTAILAVSMQLLVVQDSFLAFVDGRLIARHGLPHTDTLTYWALGHRWIDQQWGAHLVLYALATLGVQVAAVACIACVTAALTVGAVAARRLGASPRSTSIALLLPLLCSSWIAQVRTQSLALVPFVAVYALLAADARNPGRRVLLVLPVLVVWANLHGSVALAAGLTALYGVWLARRRVTRLCGAVLAVAAPLSLLASPYGFDLAGYYRFMLLHPPFASYVAEWKPPVLAIPTLPFFLSTVLVAVLWARHRRALTSFERWAVVLLLAAAFVAVRNGVWFELAAVVSLPRLLDAAWPSRIVLSVRLRRIHTIAGLAAATLAALVLLAQLAKPAPGAAGRTAAAAIAAAAGTHGIVIADDFHADWLLWEQPSLAGRVAYDVRFELFDARQMRAIDDLQRGLQPVWRRCGRAAAVVTFPDAAHARRARQRGMLAPGARTLVRSPFVAVAQPPAASRCRRL